MQNNLKKLTILHSNDFHGDFFAEQVDEKLVGGVSYLSGYINKVRDEEKNVIYAIAGDMFRGSLIDSEYKGMSTIHIMNLLAPDVVSLGNHEVDYGLTHLLFLEKCANFTIICANMYIRYLGKRLFSAHWIKEIDGMRILFIGILTKDVLASTKTEGLIGMVIDLTDALTEVKTACEEFRTQDIDLTVLLTHIGFEQDQKLAAALDPAWGVDIIIGGHSHTRISEPCVVAGIPVVQAAIGTNQIGRFDIMVDTDKKCIDSYTWQCIPITSENCPCNKELEEVVNKYGELTYEKYSQILTRFPRTYTHPARNRETELGSLIAEGLREQLGADLVILGSGVIRIPSLGPIVTLKDLTEVFPYNNSVYGFKLTGKQLHHAMQFMLRDENMSEKGHSHWFQFSRGFFCEYDRPSKKILSLKMNGKEVKDDDLFKVAMQEYHFLNINGYLNISHEDIEANGQPIEIAGKAASVLQDYFKTHEHLEFDGEKRLVIHE